MNRNEKRFFTCISAIPFGSQGTVLMDGVAAGGCGRRLSGSVLVEVGGAVRHASQAPVNQWPARSEPSVWSAAWLLCQSSEVTQAST